MKHISGCISKATLVLVMVLTMLQTAEAQKDTLRTYGPRFGLDLARFAYILADPSEIGAEVSMDFELVKNLYPVVELGFSSISEDEDFFSYSAGGAYGRLGFDYNLINLKDRRDHHSFTIGMRYGLAVFSQEARNIHVPNPYWGDYLRSTYEKSLQGHWTEIVAGVKAEMLPNLFMGWSLRYKILLNPDMDPQVPPYLVPGYGTGGKETNFGVSYSIFYKIPLIKK